ncbi:MAG: ComF family protein [Bacteroidia bacterium]
MACKTLLYKHEQGICNHCYISIPKSNFHREAENDLAKVFFGRAPLKAAGCYYLFEKNGKVQRLLHHIKYRNDKALAVQIGRWYAGELKGHEPFAGADVIIPVPLHIKKQKQRGFNQSEEFAKGISETLNIPLVSDNLVRNVYTATQTRRHRFERWENVDGVFGLKAPQLLENKHVILVDDVITTGATIDACCQALGKVPGVSVSVLSLAFAKRS